ncbi:hypothetical protein CK203_106473 [Vitis vinifera]|uniref:Retrovirus-related Pol polyprotein from transposon RE1 n=1 Tax=Vitis vinifera TaxID=29760 RepID=A0A438CHX2_VITVI|nr:hypothetical protein CK203_106473 [Vitis vinifera]
MVSFSTSDASYETSKIDHQTKSWKENTTNQSSNSKKCNHYPCTTKLRNQFSVEGRISTSCNTNQNTEASCVNPTRTLTVVATKISTVAASTNDHNTVITTETPTDVALGASGHNSNTTTTIGTLSHIESTSSYKPANVSNFLDIINKAYQHFQAPTKTDLRAIKGIFRYLKGTMEHGISKSHLPCTFQAYRVGLSFCSGKVASGVLITRFLPSALQVADIFTEALPKTSFQVFRFKLGVHKLPLTSLRGADKGNSNSAS